MENLSEGDCCDCHCHCHCDGGKTKSTPSLLALGFRLRLEFDNTLDSYRSSFAHGALAHTAASPPAVSLYVW